LIPILIPMTKKNLYTFETTLKKNIILNDRYFNEVLNNTQRLVQCKNNLRDIHDDHYQTENFDKYFNTFFSNNRSFNMSQWFEDDDDDF